MLFLKVTIQQRQDQRVIIKGINGKKLLILFGKKLNLNLKKKEEKEKEERNDKKTPPLQQVAPV